jgi:hypothetical protein
MVIQLIEEIAMFLRDIGREADYSPSTSAEVKKVWNYTSTLHTSSWRIA